MPAKNVFVRLLRGTEHLTSNSFKHWATWLGCTGTVALIAYLIASAVPEFSSLISLIGAFLGTFLTFQPYAGMWLYDNWHRKDLGIWWYGGVCWSVLIIGVGTFLQISGTYAAVVNIIAAHKEPGGSAVWSCVDNSNS